MRGHYKTKHPEVKRIDKLFKLYLLIHSFLKYKTELKQEAKTNKEKIQKLNKKKIT